MSELSVFRNFIEFWGACCSMVKRKHCLHKTRAALWFVKVIEDENLSASGSSSQALVLLRIGSPVGAA